MYDMTPIKMLMATAVLAAVAARVAGPANAFVLDAEAGTPAASAVGPGGGQASTIPYLSHGSASTSRSCRDGNPSGRVPGRHDPVPQPGDRRRREPLLRGAAGPG